MDWRAREPEGPEDGHGLGVDPLRADASYPVARPCDLRCCLAWFRPTERPNSSASIRPPRFTPRAVRRPCLVELPLGQMRCGGPSLQLGESLGRRFLGLSDVRRGRRRSRWHRLLVGISRIARQRLRNDIRHRQERAPSSLNRGWGGTSRRAAINSGTRGRRRPRRLGGLNHRPYRDVASDRGLLRVVPGRSRRRRRRGWRWTSKAISLIAAGVTAKSVSSVPSVGPAERRSTLRRLWHPRPMSKRCGTRSGSTMSKCASTWSGGGSSMSVSGPRARRNRRRNWPRARRNGRRDRPHATLTTMPAGSSLDLGPGSRPCPMGHRRSCCAWRFPFQLGPEHSPSSPPVRPAAPQPPPNSRARRLHQSSYRRDNQVMLVDFRP